MTILDRKKIRPDILKIWDEGFKEIMKFILQFTELEENKQFNFLKIYKKVLDLNELFFKKKAGMVELHDKLTGEERNYITGLLRYAIEHSAIQELEDYPIPKEIEIKSTMLEKIPAEWVLPSDPIEDHIILYLHGGGWILGSPLTCRRLNSSIVEATRLKILSIDYRLAPEHPFPVPLEDCVNAYKWLLANGFKSDHIIIAGDSAGGNLTLTTLLKIRDLGIDLPAGAICLSPATDFTLADDSYFKNAETDPSLADVGVFWWYVAYLAGEDPRNPYISPLFADLKGLPPILVQASSCEMLYSDATRFVEKAKKAGTNAILQSWDDMSHVFQGLIYELIPEAKDAISKIADFTNLLFKI
ncbi:MAG: alpha/beta hydrolase [Promethearchaeota archaeon Loki_b31]|nr:MAG: alpha/beta hydrolase [Candidatus Lokiarchaeota archaeon Loki_b31]